MVDPFYKPWATSPTWSWLTLRRSLIITAVLHAIAVGLWLTLRFTLDDRVLKLPVTWDRYEFNITLANNTIPYTNPPEIATNDIATGVLQVDELWRTEIYIYAVLFSSISFIAQLYAYLRFNEDFLPNVRRGVNPIQWIEYSFSASLMMVAISHVSGIFQFKYLIVVFFLTAAVMTYGAVMETTNPLEGNKFMYRDVMWWPYIVGFFLFFAPWVIVFIHIAQEDDVPTFVYGVVASQLFMFLTFPLNQFLHYRLWYVRHYGRSFAERRKYANLSYARSVSINHVLSFTAKFVLPAWIFFGSLRDFGPVVQCAP